MSQRRARASIASLNAVSLAASCALGLPLPGSAQEGETTELDRVTVTGSSDSLTRMRSSLARSALDADELARTVPANVADVLRNVPGILAQSSGGEGNANITARGMPMGGGAKFTQFQEDGLPVLIYGDINFATADTFLRLDGTLDRLEVLRGGSAATHASNAPGAVFNVISRTGETASRSVGLTQGIDFRRTRLDFEQGGPLDARWRYHVGGFVRRGEGPRSVGSSAERGGQFKGNLTRQFDRGYLRVNLKLLDDHAPVNLPVPVSITGTTDDPRVDSLPGFDAGDGAMQSRYFRDDLAVGAGGRARHTDIDDGYDVRSRAIGLETAWDLGRDWAVELRLRHAATSAGFVGPYPAQVDAAATLASEIGGPGASLRYATGPRAGQVVAEPGALNGNGLAVRTHLFNTTLNDLGHDVGDLRFHKRWDAGDAGSHRFTLAYFKSRQRIDQDWHWNTYLQEVRGRDGALLDVVDAQGRLVTQRGLVAYGEPSWGNCCVRAVQVRYDTDAPYTAWAWQRGALNVDASARFDRVRARGRYAGAAGTQAFDVDGDGTLQPPEQAVPIVDLADAAPVRYTVRYRSWSLGANLLLSPRWAVFGRTSEGGRANADRLLFGGGLRADGSVPSEVAVNRARQVEGGLKWRGQRTEAVATLFRTTTRVADQDITSVTERYVRRTYRADGLELEAGARAGAFSLRGGLTWTRGRVQRDEITPANVGQAINPRVMAQLMPSYRGEHVEGGFNVIALSKFPNGAGIAAPGFTQVNAWMRTALARDVLVTVTVNNLFDRLGITEIPNAAAGITASGANTARSIDGRTIAAALTVAF